MMDLHFSQLFSTIRINAVTTYVVQMDGGKFTSLGGYTTEFSADGNKEMYKIDFENWLAENILN